MAQRAVLGTIGCPYPLRLRDLFVCVTPDEHTAVEWCRKNALLSKERKCHCGREMTASPEWPGDNSMGLSRPLLCCEGLGPQWHLVRGQPFAYCHHSTVDVFLVF